jgi:high-affinity iron transporter
MIAALVVLLALAAPAAASGASPAAQAEGLGAVVDNIVARGDALVEAYDAGQGAVTADGFSDLYFDQFEERGLEAAIGSRDPSLKADLEARFAKIIGLAGKGAPAADVSAAWNALRDGLVDVRPAYAEAGGGWLATALQSFFILLREGIEALLVVTALITYVQRTGARHTMPMLYGGIVAGLGASLAVAWAVRTSVLGLDGRALEVVEGATMLIAAALLLYVGHWLFARREAQHWQAYLRDKVGAAVAAGGGLSLASVAFLAVFREGAETVLFYMALLSNTSGQTSAVAGGFAAAAVALAVIFVAMRAVGVRLPVRPFFTVTSILLMVFAFTFAGRGVAELQVIQWVPTTPVEAVPSISWLGIAPTLETLAAQGLLLAIAALGFAVPALRRRTA